MFLCDHEKCMKCVKTFYACTYGNLLIGLNNCLRLEIAHKIDPIESELGLRYLSRAVVHYCDG